MVKSMAPQCSGKNFIAERNYQLNSKARALVLRSPAVVVGSDIYIHPRVLLFLIAPNIVLVRGKRSMFKVKTLLALIQSLFYPPQAIHIDGVDPSRQCPQSP